MCQSAQGYYLGFWHCQGPISRESIYFINREMAEKALPQWRDFTRDIPHRS